VTFLLECMADVIKLGIGTCLWVILGLFVLKTMDWLKDLTVRWKDD